MMLGKIVYVNHMNEKIEFGKNEVIIQENDLLDFAYKTTSKNDRISGFKKSIVTKKIPVIIKCDSEKESIRQKNRLFEVFAKDTLAKQYGKFVVGDYYLKCYLIESKKSGYIRGSNYIQVTLKVTTDSPYWIKETTTAFSANSGSTSEFLDFPYDFDHDFKNELVSETLVNTGFVASNFRITIYGYVLNPTLYINGHEYTVNVEVETGDYLTIDSVNKTIILTKYDGQKVNCYKERNTDSYIFEKIPAGSCLITSPNDQICFDVTLLEERGEPKWT